jgi:hypothetical protein
VTGVHEPVAITVFAWMEFGRVNTYAAVITTPIVTTTNAPMTKR